MCRIPSSHFTGIACKACIASSVVTTIEQGMTTRNLTANARLKHRSGFHSVAFFSATAQMEKLAKSCKNAEYWKHNTLSTQQSSRNKKISFKGDTIPLETFLGVVVVIKVLPCVVYNGLCLAARQRGV